MRSDAEAPRVGGPVVGYRFETYPKDVHVPFKLAETKLVVDPKMTFARADTISLVFSVENLTRELHAGGEARIKVRGLREAAPAEFAGEPVPDDRLPVLCGWTQDDLKGFLVPMAETGRESVGSMGDDAPPAFLSTKDRRLYDHFKQAFAQVTNPPIDPIRERFVTGLFKYLGSEDNLLGDAPEFHGAVHLEGPVLSPRELGPVDGPPRLSRRARGLPRRAARPAVRAPRVALRGGAALHLV